MNEVRSRAIRDSVSFSNCNMSWRSGTIRVSYLSVRRHENEKHFRLDRVSYKKRNNN